MPISRRFFLKAGSLTAIVAGVALRPNILALGRSLTRATNLGYQVPITAQQQPSFMFTRATFDPYVGGIFQSPDARGRMVNLTLLSATSKQPVDGLRLSTTTASQTDCFSLMFKAARVLPESPSIHQMSHPALGSFELFLTPRSQAGGGMGYEAVFNHI